MIIWNALQHFQPRISVKFKYFSPKSLFKFPFWRTEMLPISSFNALYNRVFELYKHGLYVRFIHDWTLCFFSFLAANFDYEIDNLSWKKMSKFMYCCRFFLGVLRMLERLSSTLVRLLVFLTVTPSLMSELMAENSKEPEVDVTAVVTEFKLELRIEEFASVYCSRLLSINVLPFGFVFQISFLYVGLAKQNVSYSKDCPDYYFCHHLWR